MKMQDAYVHKIPQLKLKKEKPQQAHLENMQMYLGPKALLGYLLKVYMRIKLHLDLQVDKSSVVVKGPFFT
jgi:hypothetical protein